MSSLPKDRSLFAERVVLKLLEISRKYDGVLALNGMERARRFGHLKKHQDISDLALGLLGALDKLAASKGPVLEDAVMEIFWLEMGEQVILPPAQARLVVGMPPGTKAQASVIFELDDVDVKRVSAIQCVTPAYLKLASFEIKGSTPNFFDDVAIFDLRGEDPLDLAPLSSVVIAGTTISYYYPAMHHADWFMWARPFNLPPAFRLDKKLELVFNKQVSADVNCCVFGVDVARASPTPH